MATPAFEPVRLNGRKVILIDQRELPARYRKITCRTERDVWHAIRNMTVRGAPAIGIAAAYGTYLGLLKYAGGTREQFLKRLKRVGDYLKTSRPTAVNLAWAVERVQSKAGLTQERDASELLEVVRAEATQIHREDLRLSTAIGKAGARVLRSGDGVLTHCNAGGLATSGFGTALSVVFTAKRVGKKINVFATETRPLLQGSRLTMWELDRSKVPATLICDSAVGMLMRAGKISKVIVGADRIARNGDTANKIGTYSIASLARLHKIPFFVAAPSSTVDFSIADGSLIPIETRSPEEIVNGFGRRTAPKGVQAYNPAFDITPHQWITAFITEQGVLKPPFSSSLRCFQR